MAGLRLGYGIGQPETLKAISRAWNLGSINTLTQPPASRRCATRSTSRKSVLKTRASATTRSRRSRAWATRAGRHTNCIFVDLKRPAKEFRDACAALKVSVGRDFPPFEKTHSRISLGTMDEMKQAVQVFRKVLTASTRSKAR